MASFLHELKMYVSSNHYFCPKPMLQTLQLNCLFSAWTESICDFKPTLCAKIPLQISHLCGFFHSWTESICYCKPDLGWKVPLHISHWNGFFPSWTETKCVCKLDFVEKVLLQMSHLNDFFLHELKIHVCSNPKLALQTLHLNFFFPSWTVDKCLFIWYLYWLHIEFIKLQITTTPSSLCGFNAVYVISFYYSTKANLRL